MLSRRSVKIRLLDLDLLDATANGISERRLLPQPSPRDALSTFMLAKPFLSSTQIRPRRSTKVLIAIRVSMVSHRIVCDTRNGQLRKKSSASPNRCENTGKRCKDEGLVRLDKPGFNTFLERLEIRPSWGANEDSNSSMRI